MIYLKLLVLVVLLAVSSSSFCAEPHTQGQVTNGLQMSLSILDVSPTISESSRIGISFANLGDKDVLLELGEMLGNGRFLSPSSIRLKVIDPNTKFVEYTFVDNRYAVVAGRVDDFVLPLRAGSDFTFKFDLSQFRSTETKQFGVKFHKGSYSISAFYRGEDPKFATALWLDKSLFWKGIVQSNVLKFIVK